MILQSLKTSIPWASLYSSTQYPSTLFIPYPNSPRSSLWPTTALSHAYSNLLTTPQCNLVQGSNSSSKFNKMLTCLFYVTSLWLTVLFPINNHNQLSQSISYRHNPPTDTASLIKLFISYPKLQPTSYSPFHFVSKIPHSSTFLFLN